MKPIWKWVIGVIVFTLAALVGVGWYLSDNWEPIVEDKLKEVVRKSTDSLYNLTYDKLSINVALGNVSMENVVLRADTTIYSQMEAAKKAPDNRYDIQLKTLRIKRFGLIDILTKRHLNIKSIEVEAPSVTIFNTYHAYNDTLSNEPDKTLYESIKEVLTSVNIRDISLEHVVFKYVKLEEGKTSETHLSNIKVQVHDVLIDETSVNDSSRFYYTKLVEVDVPGFTYDLADGIYVAKFDGLKINTKDKNILLTNVDYKPKLNKAAYFKSESKAKLMTVLHFDTLRIAHFDFRKFVENQQTIAQHVQLKNGYVKLYSDKRVPKKSQSQIGKAPHQKLLAVRRLIDIDSVLVDNVSVEYGEISAKYHREGIISFDHTRGVLGNLTNDAFKLEKNKYLTADLQSRVMDSGNLNVHFSFDMLSKEGDYSYKGTLGRMGARSFNKILHPLLNVEIASGNIRSLRFDMVGNDYRTRGDFRFDYDNLKVNLLNERDEQGKQKSKKVLSFLVNSLIINDSNPDANEIYHVGKVNYKRVAEYTFFKNLWKSLLEGIKQTAGISKEREDRLMGQADRATKTAEKTKGFFKRIFKKKKQDE